MIYIENYANPLAPLGNNSFRDLSSLLGQSVAVRTAAGDFTGVVVGEDSSTLTLGYTRRTRGRSENRKIVVAKRHIIAIEMRLR